MKTYFIVAAAIQVKKITFKCCYSFWVYEWVSNVNNNVSINLWLVLGEIIL